MLRNLLGVQKLDKPTRRKGSGEIFAETEITQNIGIIRFVGEDIQNKYSEGQKVVVGNQREEIRMNGLDIMVMEDKNVFAIVEASDEESKPEENSQTE